MSTDIGHDTTVGTFQAAGYPSVDFDDFHRHELPRRLREGRNDEVAWDVAGAAPVAVQLPDGPAYSYVENRGRVQIVPGVVDDAEVVLEIPYQAWQDYVYEFRTRFGLLYSRAVRFVRGDFDAWDTWEPAIRCMYSGRPIYNPAALTFTNLDGTPMDLHRAFGLDDSPDEMSHFLRSTGFLVVKDAFAGRLQELSDEVDRLRDEAREGELWSWWASDETGRRFPFRLLYMALRSELIASLDDDPMVRFLIGLGHEDVVPVPDRVEGHLAVLKPFGKGANVTGFANLPWHKDCGLGGCPITCPAVQAGIQLDAANASSSQLVMMAGSHGKVCHDRPTEEQMAGLPIVALEAEPGDASVHMTCALHAGPEPTGPNPRRTLYVPFYSPRTHSLIGHLQGYQQVIPGWGEGDIATPEDVASTY
jgi:hypothetical protein